MPGMKQLCLAALAVASLAAPADARPLTAGEAARAIIAALEARDRTAALALFAEDAVVEYPFDRSGRTAPGSWRRFEGKPAVARSYVDNALRNIVRIDFTDEVVTESRDGRTAFVEARGDMQLAAGIGDGRPYRNLYVIKVATDAEGRITHYAEYLNPVTAALATGAPLGDAAATLPGAGGCDAARAQETVGQPYDAALLARARDLAGAAIARPLRPGQIVTQEHRADRLNLEVDAGGRVTAARCG
jgi:ketosteroid isomerase-like protein